MGFVEQAFAGRQVFVELPVGIEEWIPVVEVAVQEGLRALAFHADETDVLTQALGLFGRRARLGVWGAATPDAVAGAVAAGAHFVTSPVARPEVADAAGAVPFLPGGLTPAELVAADGEVVQVVPADVMPMAYARALPSLLGGRGFIASGRLERFQAQMWFDAGAQAVGIAGGVLVGDDPSAVDLGLVRERCQSYASVAPGE